MSLPRVHPGQPLSAARHNHLIEHVNALARPGTPAEAQFGAGGTTFYGPPPTLLAMFELTGWILYPQIPATPTGQYVDDPTPFAPAKQVWCFPQSTIEASGVFVRSYGIENDAPEPFIWFPFAPRDANGYGIGPPLARAGDRVLCLFNRQSGRWEVVQGPPFVMTCCAVLNQTLSAMGSATVSLWWDGQDSGMDVPACDWLLPAGGTLPPGTKVIVQFLPQDGLWWVTGYTKS